ncbi:hypothetical protein KKA13_02785 [Patescibacteria group bacterium]|nr:hypothetical protein [Patescibacteria group bacterium]
MAILIRTALPAVAPKGRRTVPPECFTFFIYDAPRVVPCHKDWAGSRTNASAYILIHRLFFVKHITICLPVI